MSQNIGRFTDGEVELIATGWHMQKGGKIPGPVVEKGDAYLRRHAQREPRVVLALSHPNEQEKKRASQMFAVWASTQPGNEQVPQPGRPPMVQALTPH